jgi:hypothetical protein
MLCRLGSFARYQSTQVVHLVVRILLLVVAVRVVVDCTPRLFVRVVLACSSRGCMYSILLHTCTRTHTYIVALALCEPPCTTRSPLFITCDNQRLKQLRSFPALPELANIHDLIHPTQLHNRPTVFLPACLPTRPRRRRTLLTKDDYARQLMEFMSQPVC